MAIPIFPCPYRPHPLQEGRPFIPFRTVSGSHSIFRMPWRARSLEVRPAVSRQPRTRAPEGSGVTVILSVLAGIRRTFMAHIPGKCLPALW